MFRATALSIAGMLLAVTAAAQEPSVSYVFPSGGQRGTTVEFKVGGHFLHGGCPFTMLGPGVSASPRITPTDTVWFEGPVIGQPGSQQAENYPKDYAGTVAIAADAPLGIRYWQVSTSQGAVPAMKFVVGDLPEVVEHEIDGEPLPVQVSLPVTINGRTFPREDVDLWSFEAAAGETIWAEVVAARIGSPLDSQLQIIDPQGQVIAENSDAYGTDSFVRFTAPAAGTYQARIYDANYDGLQHFVYRLTISRAPRVDAVYPLGGQRGSAARYELAGSGLPAELAELSIPADAAGDYFLRLETPAGPSVPFLLEADDLPEVLESEPNNDPAQAANVALPAVCNGRISEPGDSDQWAFSLVKGEAVDFDLRSARLGSPLDSVLVVLDAAGKEVARHDDLGDGQTDSRLSFSPPADGVYVVRVEDRFSSRGGPQFAYRLRACKPPAMDYKLKLAHDHLTLLRGAEVKLKVDIERLGGFNHEVKLSVEGLPAGVTVPEEISLAASAPAVEIVFKADVAAPIAVNRITVRGTAMMDGQAVTCTAAKAAARATPELDNVLLAVAMPTPFKVKGEYSVEFAPRGAVFRRYYKIERNGFEGPINISMADRQGRHLQGVSGPLVVVPPGEESCIYPVFFPPFMEVGRTSRSNVMAVGEVTDADGSKHTVAFHSLHQNEQIVALVDPCPLGLQALVTSMTARPNSTAEIPVRVQRSREVSGPTRLELIVPPHISGVSAEPVILAEGEDRGVLSVRFDSASGPFNAPLLVRATAVFKGDRVVNEAPLSVTPGP
ncbi:MAG: PPC domain-containing protein [Pirellulales bacterium]